MKSISLYKFLIRNKRVTNILLRSGILPPKYSNYLDIYLRYTELISIGHKRPNAVKVLSGYYKLSISMIYKIIGEMEQELNL